MTSYARSQMIDRFARATATLSLLVGLQLAPALAQSAEPTPVPLGIVTNTVVPVLESDHSRYTIGEPILLRASMKNETSTDQNVVVDKFWSMGRLTVRDSSGNLVKPQNPPTFPLIPGYATSRMPLALLLPAGQTMTLQWGLREGQQWVALSDWGYAPLEPGTYTIIYVLQTSGFANLPGKTPDEFRVGGRFATSDGHGNGATASVKITVAQK